VSDRRTGFSEPGLLNHMPVAAGGKQPDPDELRDFARERLARFKAPKRILVVDELPKTGTGKIQKFQLRDQVREEATA